MKEISESEYRDFQDGIATHDAIVQTLEKRIKEKNFYFSLLLVWAIIATAAYFECACQCEDFKMGAINRHYMIYNPTNGVLHWVEGLTPPRQ